MSSLLVNQNLHMSSDNPLISRDLKHIWHPCSQMKDFEKCPPLVIQGAQGSYLYTDQGPLIDAISSWWCKSLGHKHPAIYSAIQRQLNQFEHVMGANTTYPALVELGEELAQITGNQHLYLASDGSSAVEIAMKLAIHGNQIKGRAHKKEFLALSNGYHGETMGAMSISDLGIFTAPFQGLGVTCHMLNDLPYLEHADDPLWTDCTSYWMPILAQLEAVKENVCAVVLEPIVQGSAGMQCYSADFLKKIALWAKANDIYLIADEIMTGIGRTGAWLALEHAGIEADMVCLSKGLTGGTLPLSCVMLSHDIFELFYDDYESGKSFLHSHTFSANPLAVSAALATVKAMREEKIVEGVAGLGESMFNCLQEVAALSGKLGPVRGIGAIVAADLMPVKGHRMGYLVYQEALKLGAFIRPIGNSLYWLPPLNTDKETISKLAEITLHSINNAYARI